MSARIVADGRQDDLRDLGVLRPRRDLVDDTPDTGLPLRPLCMCLVGVRRQIVGQPAGHILPEIGRPPAYLRISYCGKTYEVTRSIRDGRGLDAIRLALSPTETALSHTLAA